MFLLVYKYLELFGLLLLMNDKFLCSIVFMNCINYVLNYNIFYLRYNKFFL